MPTKIEWCQETINPLPGCSKVSEGCKNCWALRMANRFKGTEKYHGLVENGEWTGRLNWWLADLEKPLRWKKPRRIFVNSMGDLFHHYLFHGDIPGDQYLNDLFHTMDIARHHQYLLLTKRPDNMKRFLENSRINIAGDYPHVWIGVTAENQKRADERIPALLQVPAAVRWVSVEPMLGSVDLSRWLPDPPDEIPFRLHNDVLQWCVVGGESGPGARPMNPDWVRSLRDQCVAAGVPFLFKQWGAWMPCKSSYRHKGSFGFLSDGSYQFDCENRVKKVGKKKSGRQLDGRTWDQYPERK